MSNAGIAAILALCAALAAAIGSVIRQRSAQQITDEKVGHLALFGMLVRDIRWWTGGLGDIASYLFLAAALDKGSVMLVTALQVTVLLFALPIYARVTRHRITGREWIWAVVLAAALGMVIAVGDPAERLQRGSPHDWLVVAAVLGPALVLCALGAKIWSDRPAAAVLLAVVSGSSLAVFAVLTKGIVDVTEHGGHLLHAWELVSVDSGRGGRDDLSAVSVPCRFADLLPADAHRRKAGGGRGTRGHRTQGDAGSRRPGVAAAR